MRPAQIFAHWKQVREGLLLTLSGFEEEQLYYRPFEGSWQVGRIALHIADAEDGWLRYVVTHELDAWPDQYTLEYYPTREAIRQALAEVHARTEAFLDTLEEADLEREVLTPRGERFALGWIIWHVLEHEIHHRGELSLILGTLGREGLDV